MIDTFRIIQNNIIGIVILFIIYLNIKPYIKAAPIDQKIFTAMLSSAVAIMLVDIATIFLNGVDGIAIKNMKNLLTALYFILNPLPFFIWTLYVNFKIYEDIERLKRLFKVAIWPTIINAVLAVASMFYGIVYFIDDNNNYNRGEWFLIVAFIYYSYSTYSAVKIIKNKKHISRKKYCSMLMFLLPPAVGGLVQAIFPELKFLWVSLSISLMMVYINLQKEQLYTDLLTGLYNRRHLESHLKQRRRLKNKTNVGMLMIDIDRFKKINDTYGHVEGDKALEYFSEILRESFRKDDNIFRYAGDEFIVVIEVRKMEELKKAVNRMKANIEKFNEQGTTPYDISVSIGYDILEHSSEMSTKAFIDHIDSLMYLEKTKNSKEIKINKDNIQTLNA